jgi:glycosyltransferase involved in cell wall biosynthesis
MGLRGKVLPVVPNSSGFDVGHVQSLRQPGSTSQRRIILLKGYQHWAGRALVGLRALAHSTNILKERGYRVAISMASPDVQIAAELFQQETGIPVEIIPNVSHDEMLRWYGRARVYIGLSISDAISTSLLEAMVMGAFPIQSCTSCADEWISDGKSGFVVPPEDPHVIADAIGKTLTDDTLVNRAAEINLQVAKARLDHSLIQPKVVQMYQDIYATRKG